MSTKKTGGLPARLETARRRLERWRRNRKGCRQIPDALWASAVKLAGEYGINRTARALRLDYYSLKKRLERQAGRSHDVLKVEDVPTFLEVGSALSAGAGECIVELEDASGAKMRVHLKGLEAPDLVALSQSFWRVDS